jgi:methanogenic corrinoid protein MtbC1
LHWPDKATIATVMMATMVILADNVTMLVRMSATTTTTMIAMTTVITQNAAMTTGITWKTIVMLIGTRIRVVTATIGIHAVMSHLACIPDTVVPAW